MERKLYKSHHNTKLVIATFIVCAFKDQFVLLSLFPNGLFPEGHMSGLSEGDAVHVDVSSPAPGEDITALSCGSIPCFSLS